MYPYDEYLCPVLAQAYTAVVNPLFSTEGSPVHVWTSRREEVRLVALPQNTLEVADAYLVSLTAYT